MEKFLILSLIFDIALIIVYTYLSAVSETKLMKILYKVVALLWVGDLFLNVYHYSLIIELQALKSFLD